MELLRGLAVLALAPLCAIAADEGWRSQGVLHVDKSPHVKLHSVPVRAVKMGPGFWEERRKINVDRSIPTLLKEMEDHGIVDNFRRLSGKKQAPRRGPLYTDSDLYKWIEAAAFVLQTENRPDLRKAVDAIIEDIVAVQEPSGYLNTYYVEEREKQRFKEMVRGHELYCLGHMLQAGIAYYRATGNRRLLDSGIKFVNYLLRDFGPTKHPLLTGHPELELALVELYRTEGKREYLDLAGYLLSGVERERLKLSDRDLKYMFSGKPFTSRKEFEGHAVRALYAASGAADYYAETGDPAYKETLDRLWTDLIRGKVYITGGVGSRSSGEAFGEPYELPNFQAYGESCAAISNLMFAYRLALINADSKYMDMVERALYNGINSGMSLSGTMYCYRNPLASNGEKIRNPWYDTLCCPPNLERTLASLPGYLYSTSKDGVYVNLFHSSTLDWKLASGTPLTIEQKTEYPWAGQVDLTITPRIAEEFTLFLRIPDWARGSTVTVNGTAVPAVQAGTYQAIRRKWNPGEKVALVLPMKIRATEANPLVHENFGKVAIERGPLVYCAERHDNSTGGSLFDLALTRSGAMREKQRPDLLGGIVTIEATGVVTEKPLGSEPLYSEIGRVRRQAKPATITLIPYYTWANREPAEMQVWIPVR